MFSCLWCKDVIEFRNSILNRNTTELYRWLKSKNYEVTLNMLNIIVHLGLTFIRRHGPCQ